MLSAPLVLSSAALKFHVQLATARKTSVATQLAQLLPIRGVQGLGVIYPASY